MHVPETPVHEDCRLMLPEEEIGSTGKSALVKAESESLPMQEAPDDAFGLRIPRPDA
jgi:hypothetical protein